MTATESGIGFGVLQSDAASLLEEADRHLQIEPAAPGGKIAGTNRFPIEERYHRLRSDPRIKQLAERALLADPLSSRALRLLGEVADASQRAASDTSPQSRQHTEALMRAAARLSGREAIAVDWLMRQAYERKDYSAAMAHADAILRANPEFLLAVMPVLVGLAENKEASPLLANALAENPAWRPIFFAYMLRSIRDARTPLSLMIALKQTAKPPTNRELGDYFVFLLENKFFELAYYTWLQFLPPEQFARAGMLFNGDFQFEPSGFPFDWAMPKGAGVTVEIAPATGGEEGRFLRVVFGEGRAEFRGAFQTTLLAPGRYRLQGQYRGRLNGRRGLEWQVRCGEGGQGPVGKAIIPLVSTPQWTEFVTEFQVPEQNCRAQKILLVLDARSVSEFLVQGEQDFRSLTIVRAK